MTGPYTIRVVPTAPGAHARQLVYFELEAARAAASALAATTPKTSRVLVMSVVNADLRSGPVALPVPVAFYPGMAT